MTVFRQKSVQSYGLMKKMLAMASVLQVRECTILEMELK